MVFGKQPHRIPLTSTDCFFLAMDYHHKKHRSENHICRYVIEVQGHIDERQIQDHLRSNAKLHWLINLTIEKRFLKIPNWVSGSKNKITPVGLHNGPSESLKPLDGQVLDFDQHTPIRFDIIYHPENMSSLVMSWHHMLMDGQGAVTLLKELFIDGMAATPFLEPQTKIKRSLKFQWEVIKLFLYHTRLFWTPFAYKFRTDYNAHRYTKATHARLNVLKFDRDETEKIRSVGLQQSSSLSLSPYYLAHLASSVKSLFDKKGRGVREFWLPIPQNLRKVGSVGAILGNQLTFLFYTIKGSEIENFDSLLNKLSHQVNFQLRRQLPRAYDSLMSSFRRLPSRLYYQLIKGSRGHSIASFLMTMAVHHPNELSHVFDHRITDAVSIPPNTFPPGCTFAFMEFQGQLRVICVHDDGAWSREDIKFLKNTLYQKLLFPDIEEVRR